MKIIFAFLIITVLTVSCSGSTSPNNPDINSDTIPQFNIVHLELGTPVDTDTTDDYKITRYQYALSYNNIKGVPNWVAWNLNSDWYGDVTRFSGNFISDTSLPASMYQVKHSDYTNSGYDRGHMVRSEERTKTVADNKSTFIIYNIIP